MSTVPQDIFNKVEPYATQNSVPDWLWETVAQEESGFDHNALGDSGTSFGIFQLHIGGQADAALRQGFTTKSLDDPGVNARFAMPAIGDAWRSLSTSFNDSYSWWVRFAAASGHPGGGPTNPATLAEATKLKSIYDSTYKGQNTGQTVTKTMAGTNTSNPSNPTTPSTFDFAHSAERAIFFLLGGGLILVGVLIAVKADTDISSIVKKAVKGAI